MTERWLSYASNQWHGFRGALQEKLDGAAERERLKTAIAKEKAKRAILVNRQIRNERVHKRANEQRYRRTSSGKSTSRIDVFLTALLRLATGLHLLFGSGRRATDSVDVFPSTRALYLLHLALPIREADDFVENLDDRFHDSWVPRFGIKRAKRIVWAQSCLAVLGFYLSRAIKALGVLVKTVS
ncbi:MAG: hypothetical protein COA62_06530 [Rhodobiaceae bacterium]|nr:MAG: hypothetical protein COA62_06530 [Rhodobiaceae bacterium]